MRQGLQWFETLETLLQVLQVDSNPTVGGYWKCPCRKALVGKARTQLREREFFIDNLLVRIHFIIVIIRLS